MTIGENKFIEREDYIIALKDIIRPLKKHYSKESARLILGNTGTYCTENITYMEAFARPLWGLIPYWAGGGENTDFYDIYLKGIRNGTDENSSEFWGKIIDKDQRMVEMAVLGLILLLTPEKFWDKLNDEEKKNLANWLFQINNFIMPETNWLFFRILVNMGLKNVGVSYDKKRFLKDLDKLDEFYIKDGWYSDGFGEQRDYYIPFGMHFYGLLYSKLAKDYDYKRCEKYKNRAVKFAEDFIYWFSKDGSAIPFGRSLTYRFAQVSFWSALAFADVEVFSWGVIKGLISRNLRWWFKKPIFSTDGILTIGYAYPNLHMAEGYNGLGSPYWALKSFLPLALDETHPFWLAKEEELPALNKKSVQVHPHMIIENQKDTNHIVAYTAGQFADFKPVHFASKYEKFVYSNIFGFSVSRSDFEFETGAYDSMLALREIDGSFVVRKKCIEYKVENDFIYSKWKPFNDVNIKTWIIPSGKWHIRVHEIDSNRDLEVIEGGFAILKNEDLSSNNITKDKNSILIDLPWALSGIYNLKGKREVHLSYAEPNTNILNQRTLIPCLKCFIKKGKYRFISGVFGDENVSGVREHWNEKPKEENIKIY
jgi:hypothetical protein